jgi:citrate lyase subunit beta/citryl-CoA lyase
VLEELHRSTGLEQRQLIVIVESFAAVAGLAETLGNLPVKIKGVGLGLEDMLVDVPHRSTDVNWLLRHIRATVALQCRARGLLGIDGISGADEADAEFAEACAEGRSCGLNAKFSIHPRQIDLINRVFSPDPGIVRWAERVAELTGLQENFGYERLGDMIITPPKIKKARYILKCKPSN